MVVVRVAGSVGSSMPGVKRPYGDIGARQHGRYSTYTQGCKCADCTKAMKKYYRRKRHPELVYYEELTHDDKIDILLEALHG